MPLAPGNALLTVVTDISNSMPAAWRYSNSSAAFWTTSCAHALRFGWLPFHGTCHSRSLQPDRGFVNRYRITTTTPFPTQPPTPSRRMDPTRVAVRRSSWDHGGSCCADLTCYWIRVTQQFVTTAYSEFLMTEHCRYRRCHIPGFAA